jgi:hypothetical protein
MNESLLKRMQQLIDNTANEGLPYISKTMEQLRIAVPDFQGKQFKDGEQPSEDHVSTLRHLSHATLLLLTVLPLRARRWSSPS